MNWKTPLCDCFIQQIMKCTVLALLGYACLFTCIGISLINLVDRFSYSISFSIHFFRRFKAPFFHSAIDGIIYSIGSQKHFFNISFLSSFAGIPEHRKLFDCRLFYPLFWSSHLYSKYFECRIKICFEKNSFS